MSRQATRPIQSAPATASAASTAVAESTVARSAHLDASLDRAHKLAVGQHHGGVSSEHLLFALTEDPEALTVLGAGPLNVERLRADIGTHLGQMPGDARANKPILPNADLLKVLKLAAMAAQQSARRQIDGAIVLAAMIGDASTPSAGLLRAHGLTFNEVIRVLQKSATPASPTAAPVATGPAPDAAPPAPIASEPPTARIVTAAPTAEPVRSGPQPAAPSTDELLASVRARLLDAAPPKPRRVEKPEVPRGDEPASAASAELGPKSDDPPTASITAAKSAEPVREPHSDIAETADQQPQTIAKPTAPEIKAPPSAHASVATSGPDLPASGSQLQQPSGMPPGQAAGQSAMQPPLPLVPAAAQRSGPPPMPLPAMAAVKGQKPVLPHPQPPSGGQMGRIQIPPPLVDLRALAAAIPKRMRQGQTSIVEVTVPRRALEIPMSPGHRWPPLRVATMRLRTPIDAAHVELASPETLWISPPRVHQGAADDATWRWRVTPRTAGLVKINLAGATRIVGGEGISGEVPLGEETVEIDVMRRGSRRGVVGVLLFGNLLAIGFLAMIMSGRASEMLGSAWRGVSGLFGH